MNDAEPLVELLRTLKARDYRFVTVTPATHASVVARPEPEHPSLRDIFGWNTRFDERDLEAPLLGCLRAAEEVEACGGKLRSRVRVASLDGELFLHSSFPTDGDDAVFFGPDTYRFARFIREQTPKLPRPAHVVDMGAGSGAGGIVAARLTGCDKLELVDVNPAALRLAACNAAAAGARVQLTQSSYIPCGANLIIANPPYIMDEAARSYRDGGDLLGGAISLEWVEQALECMAPGGTILLYTGAAVVAGRSPLMDSIATACGQAGATVAFEEIDPDVFGEELTHPAYREVERIAAIGVVISRSTG